MDTHSAYLAIGALPLFQRRESFGIVLFGAIPAIAIALVANWRFAGATVRRLTTGALALYPVCVAITGTGNVTLNNNPAEVDNVSNDTAAARSDFESA